MNLIKLMLVAVLLVVSGCAYSPPVPEFAVRYCLLSHGTPVFTADGWGNTEFTCKPNDDRNALNARYFDDPTLIEGLSDGVE